MMAEKLPKGISADQLFEEMDLAELGVELAIQRAVAQIPDRIRYMQLPGGGSPPVYTRFVSEKARWRLWPLPFRVPPGDYYERSYGQVFCVAEVLSPDLHPYGSLYVTMTGGLCTVPSADILGASRLARRDQGLPEKGAYYERQSPRTLFPLATPKLGVDDAHTVIQWCEERIRKLSSVAYILEEFR